MENIYRIYLHAHIHTKVGKDACGNLQGICEPFYNDDTIDRGLRLLEFATFNDLVQKIDLA